MNKFEILKSILQNIRRSFGLAWKVDQKLFSLLIVLNIFAALFPIAVSYSFKLLLDGLTKAHDTLSVISLGLVGVFAMRYIVELTSGWRDILHYDYADTLFNDKLENYLNLTFSEKVSGLDIAHLEDPKVQTLIDKASQGANWRIRNFVQSSFYLFSAAITFIGSFLVLLPFGFLMPIVIVLATIPSFLMRAKLIRLEWLAFNETSVEAREMRYLRMILGDADSLKEIKIFQSRNALLSRLKALQDFVFENMRALPLKKYIKRFYLTRALNFGALGILAYLKLPDVVSGAMTIGSFSFFIERLDSITRTTEGTILSQISQLYEHNLYLSHYFEVMALPKVIKEKDPGVVFKKIEPPKIQFQNVSFRYANGPMVLKRISFELMPGEHLAIVGPNGAGKTTLIKLLLRFYDPTEGNIFINGENLKDIRLDNWYSFVGTLFQDFEKFKLTVKDNILLGRADFINDVKMREAAKKAGADEFILKLSGGYNQRLGTRYEDGVELSTGQWQRLALARAFYHESPILVLDEPTSAIDAEAEAEIFNNLENIYKDKTLIFISHRFSTVKNADKIIVFQDGEIKEEGSHASLTKKKGTYARMFAMQAKGYAE